TWALAQFLAIDPSTQFYRDRTTLVALACPTVPQVQSGDPQCWGLCLQADRHSTVFTVPCAECSTSSGKRSGSSTHSWYLGFLQHQQLAVATQHNYLVAL